MLNTVAMADDYFSTNYYGAAQWIAVPEDAKDMLIATAEEDIAMALSCELDPSIAIHTEKPYTCIQKAIFEWALYLYANKSKLLKRLNSTSTGISSVEVDGIGKETYTGKGKTGDWYTDCIWNSRAGQFLSMIQREVRIIR